MSQLGSRKSQRPTALSAQQRNAEEQQRAASRAQVKSFLALGAAEEERGQRAAEARAQRAEEARLSGGSEPSRASNKKRDAGDVLDATKTGFDLLGAGAASLQGLSHGRPKDVGRLIKSSEDVFARAALPLEVASEALRARDEVRNKKKTLGEATAGAAGRMAAGKVGTSAGALVGAGLGAFAGPPGMAIGALGGGIAGSLGVELSGFDELGGRLAEHGWRGTTEAWRRQQAELARMRRELETFSKYGPGR